MRRVLLPVACCLAPLLSGCITPRKAPPARVLRMQAIEDVGPFSARVNGEETAVLLREGTVIEIPLSGEPPAAEPVEPTPAEEEDIFQAPRRRISPCSVRL